MDILYRVQCLRRNRFHRLVAVDLNQTPFGLVIVHQGQRLPLIGLQAFGNNLLPVVLAATNLRAV